MANRSDPDRKDQIAARKLLLVFVLVAVVGIWLLSRFFHAAQNAIIETPASHASTQQSVPASVSAPPPSPPTHEQRLSDLQKQREGLESSFEIEGAFAKKIARDAMELSTKPPSEYRDWMPGWTYANERQFLMDSMDKEELKLHKLKGEIDAVDAEIAKEEQQEAAKGTNNSACLEYAPSPAVKLKGTISSKVFPGIPNYQSIENGDEPETVWVLLIAGDPICTNAGPEQEDHAESDVRDMQLLFTKAAMYDTYRDQLGKPVTVTGYLFHALTGHHHTNVLFQVVGIEQ